MVFYWQYVDNWVEAQGSRIICEMLLNNLGKNFKKLYGCPQEFRPLQIPNLYTFPGKIMFSICHWTQENVFATTVFCNHKETYAFSISLGSTCHFLGSYLVIRVRKEATQLCQILWKFIQLYYMIEMSEFQFTTFKCQ